MRNFFNTVYCKVTVIRRIRNYECKNLQCMEQSPLFRNTYEKRMHDILNLGSELSVAD